DLLYVGCANGWQPVRQKDDHRGTIAGLKLSERRHKRVVDVSATLCSQVVDEFEPCLPGVAVRFYETGLHQMFFAGKGDDVETVARGKRLDAELERGLCFFYLLATHGAGGVQNKDDVLGCSLLLADVRFWRDEHEEIPILARFAMRQQR